VLIADLSGNNPAVDFRKLAAHGVRGVYLKATEGATFTDTLFRERRRQAYAAGLHVGAYHYARPDTGADPKADAQAEARHFCDTVQALNRDDLRPALDLEVGRARAGYVEWSRVWNIEVLRMLGAGPLFYSYPFYIGGLHAAEPIGYGLWLADYGPNDGARHTAHVPAPWRKCVLHQYTSNAHVPGVAGNCDLSYAGRLRPLYAFPMSALLRAPTAAARRIAGRL
jgi:GH25 family lysozyme M1 (1,4-beta-N-acetylmuramidase)